MSTRIRFIIAVVALTVGMVSLPVEGQARDSTLPPRKGAATTTTQTMIQPPSRQNDTGMVRRTKVDTTTHAQISDMQQMKMPGAPSMADTTHGEMSGMSNAAMSQQDLGTLMKSMVQLMALQMHMLADPVINQRVRQDSSLRRQLNGVIAIMSQDSSAMAAMSERDAAASMENMPGMKMTQPSGSKASSEGTRRTTSSAKPRPTATKTPAKSKADSASKAGQGAMKMPGMKMPGMNMGGSKKP